MKRLLNALFEVFMYALVMLSVMLILWFFISLFDTAVHNIALREGYGDYLDWNLFSIVIDMIN